MDGPPRRPLVVVVVAQFLVLGVWFAPAAVLAELAAAHGLGAGQAGQLTAATVLGFVAGTLAFAVLNVADRFPAPRVFCLSAIVAAIANAAPLVATGLGPLVAARLVAGVALAGVYPVGMKILASWYEHLGWALGLLVGALTLGSGSPFLVRATGASWQAVLLVATTLAVAGGILVATLRPGPRLPARAPFRPAAFVHAFQVPAFRHSALGYFGHMWELYAYWGLLPAFLLARGDLDPGQVAAMVFASFLAGAVACVVGGFLSRRVGPARVARAALIISAAACLASPVLFVLPMPGAALFVIVWGAAVVADSPQFSAISAQAAPRQHVGTALTIQNAIGFAITLVPLAALPLVAAWGWRWAFLWLAPGPLLGIWAVAALVPHASNATPSARVPK